MSEHEELHTIKNISPQKSLTDIIINTDITDIVKPRRKSPESLPSNYVNITGSDESVCNKNIDSDRTPSSSFSAKNKTRNKLVRQLSNSAPGLDPNSINIQSVVIKKRKPKYINVKSKIDIGKKNNDSPQKQPTMTEKSHSKTSEQQWESQFVLERNPHMSEETKTLEQQKTALKNQDLSEALIAKSMQENIMSIIRDDAETMETQEITITPPTQAQFIHPKKTSKMAAIMQPITPTVNRYTPLTNTEAEQEVRSRTTLINKPKHTNNNRGSTKPPPIVIQGRPNNHLHLISELKTHIKKGFYIKYAPKSILIYITDKNEYHTYKGKLVEAADTPFHTYTSNEEKTHAFVLRGLQSGPTADEVKDDIEANYDIEIKNIYQMKTKYSPLYLVITTSDVTLNMLQNKIKYILYTKVSWERRHNERIITQCRRCQGWGHATSNCYKKPRCVKCAEFHWTKDCKKSQDSEPKCANCSGNHTASNTECPVYNYRLQKINSQLQPQETQTLVPAPQPTTNPWTHGPPKFNQTPQTTGEDTTARNPHQTRRDPSRESADPTTATKQPEHLPVLTLVPSLSWAVAKGVSQGDNCWMVDTNGYQWINDGFRITVLAVNTFLLLDIIRIMLLKMKHGNTSRQTKAAFRATLFLIPLFGIHILFTAKKIVYDDSCLAEDVYEFARYTMEALQGVFVAILFCYANTEVHNEIRNGYRKFAIYCNQKFGWNLKTQTLYRRRTTAATYVQPEYDN